MYYAPPPYRAACSNIRTTAIITLALAIVSPAGATLTAWAQLPQDQFGENIASDVDWRQIMLPPTSQTAPNWVVADDFRSDGRPITGVRWWGSYFNPAHQPQLDTDSGRYIPVIEDVFAFSFFTDIPAPPTGGGFSKPGGLLGSWAAPIGAVTVTPTPVVGWDGHTVWEYVVHFDQAHFDHQSPLTHPEGLDGTPGDIYWLSIVATNGHEIDPSTWQDIDTQDPVEQEHWWGWHTSPDQFNDTPTMSRLDMPGEDWVYDPNWTPIDTQHGVGDMAFELWTIPEPSSSSLMVLAGSLILLRRSRTH